MATWEERVMALFQAKVWRAEAKAKRARARARQSPQETGRDEKDLRLAEDQRRLQEEKARLEQELSQLERTALMARGNLEQQIKWHERMLEAVKRQRKESIGFATTLEY